MQTKIISMEFIDSNGSGVTGLTPTLTVFDDNNFVVVENVEMEELSNGVYKYSLQLDSARLYYAIAYGGAEFPYYARATNANEVQCNSVGGGTIGGTISVDATISNEDLTKISNQVISDINSSKVKIDDKLIIQKIDKTNRNVSNSKDEVIKEIRITKELNFTEFKKLFIIFTENTTSKEEITELINKFKSLEFSTNLSKEILMRFLKFDKLKDVSHSMKKENNEKIEFNEEEFNKLSIEDQIKVTSILK